MPALFSAFVGVGAYPGCGLGGFVGYGLGSNFHGIEDAVGGEDSGIWHGDGGVGAGHGVHVFDTLHDGVILLFGDGVHCGGERVVAAVVPCTEAGVPGFPEDLATESTYEVFVLIVVIEKGVLAFRPLKARVVVRRPRTKPPRFK